MGYNKRYKRLSELTIAELACNKNLDEILDLQDLLKQSIRSHLSRLLFLTDVDEPLEYNIKFFRTPSHLNPLTLSRTLADDSSRHRE